VGGGGEESGGTAEHFSLSLLPRSLAARDRDIGNE
jgi:hypothetical protein